MPWYSVRCTFPGCGQSYVSMSAADGICPDTNHHYNLERRASKESYPVHDGKPMKASGPHKIKQSNKKKGFCNYVLLPPAIGIAYGIAKLAKLVLR